MIEQLGLEETLSGIKKSKVIQILKEINPKKKVDLFGFKETISSLIEETYIIYIPEVSPEEVSKYCEVLNSEFGKPLKNFEEETNSKIEELRDYLHLLNRINESPVRGEMFRRRETNLVELAESIVKQQREGSPLNDWQCFYGRKSEDITKIELVRICPYYHEDLSSIEYVLSSISENTSNKSQMMN